MPTSNESNNELQLYGLLIFSTLAVSYLTYRVAISPIPYAYLLWVALTTSTNSVNDEKETLLTSLITIKTNYNQYIMPKHGEQNREEIAHEIDRKLHLVKQSKEYPTTPSTMSQVKQILADLRSDTKGRLRESLQQDIYQVSTDKLLKIKLKEPTEKYLACFGNPNKNKHDADTFNRALKEAIRLRATVKQASNEAASLRCIQSRIIREIYVESHEHRTTYKLISKLLPTSLDDSLVLLEDLYPEYTKNIDKKNSFIVLQIIKQLYLIVESHINNHEELLSLIEEEIENKEGRYGFYRLIDDLIEIPQNHFPSFLLSQLNAIYMKEIENIRNVNISSKTFKSILLPTQNCALKDMMEIITKYAQDTKKAYSLLKEVKSLSVFNQAEKRKMKPAFDAAHMRLCSSPSGASQSDEGAILTMPLNRK